VSGDEPGNTLEAFAASVARGVEAIELDVRRTADGVLVVWHDADAGGEPIALSAYAALRARVPSLCTLDEALDAIPSACFLDVEIKVPGIEAEVLDELGLNREKDAFVVTCFRDETVARVKALDPGVGAGLILERGGRRRGCGPGFPSSFPSEGCGAVAPTWSPPA